MSSPEPALPRLKLFGLIVAHLVVAHVGTVVAFAAGRSPTVWGGALIGIVFGQLSLLGMWVSLGARAWWQRVIGVFFGAAYLTLLLGAGIHEMNAQTLFVVVSAVTLVITPLSIARFFRVAVRLDSSPAGSLGRLQFTLRHLLILTFVVACLLAAGKCLRVLTLGFADELLLFGVTFGLVGVMPIWFILATKRPLVYSAGVVLVAAFAGYYLGLLNRHEAILWITATTAESMAVVASLLAIRLWGYRLVWLGGKA